MGETGSIGAGFPISNVLIINADGVVTGHFFLTTSSSPASQVATAGKSP
ncbi:MAG: hypothetical protein JXA42_25895 [Anaerolineales bacterium]|nr:hypothetical protein [Anaerolineales bacterium]